MHAECSNTSWWWCAKGVNLMHGRIKLANDFDPPLKIGNTWVFLKTFVGSVLPDSALIEK